MTFLLCRSFLLICRCCNRTVSVPKRNTWKWFPKSYQCPWKMDTITRRANSYYHTLWSTQPLRERSGTPWANGLSNSRNIPPQTTDTFRRTIRRPHPQVPHQTLAGWFINRMDGYLTIIHFPRRETRVSQIQVARLTLQEYTIPWRTEYQPLQRSTCMVRTMKQLVCNFIL